MNVIFYPLIVEYQLMQGSGLPNSGSWMCCVSP